MDSNGATLLHYACCQHREPSAAASSATMSDDLNEDDVPTETKEVLETVDYVLAFFQRHDLLEVKDNTGRSAFSSACQVASDDVLLRMIEAGCDINTEDPQM